MVYAYFGWMDFLFIGAIVVIFAVVMTICNGEPVIVAHVPNIISYKCAKLSTFEGKVICKYVLYSSP
jgi:hypothetical protein